MNNRCTCPSIACTGRESIGLRLSDRCCGLRMQGRRGLMAAALGNHIARSAFAAAALGGNPQLKLDVVKAHASMGMTGNFTVRDATADTDNHGTGQSKNRWHQYK